MAPFKNLNVYHVIVTIPPRIDGTSTQPVIDELVQCYVAVLDAAVQEILTALALPFFAAGSSRGDMSPKFIVKAALGALLRFQNSSISHVYLLTEDTDVFSALLIVATNASWQHHPELPDGVIDLFPEPTFQKLLVPPPSSPLVAASCQTPSSLSPRAPPPPPCATP